ncbi:MAG: hypothetical protein R3Y51_03640 [Rikenellaceae bacterium]
MRIFFIFFTFLLTACGNSPKYIDDTTLKSVFFDLAMHDAVMVEVYNDIKRDTTYFFDLVLQKNGVTLEDFEYTIEKKILRKSNVLPELMTQLEKEIGGLKKQYNYKAKILDNWDNKADSIYSYNLYLDSLSLNHADSIENAVIKVNLNESGEIKVRSVYVIDTLDKNRSPSMNITLVDTISGKSQVAITKWLSKYTVRKPTQILEMSANYDAKVYNQAIITYYATRSSKMDKSFYTPYMKVDTMEINFHYTKLTARKMLLDSVLNITNYKRKTAIQDETKDSSPLSVYIK